MARCVRQCSISVRLLSVCVLVLLVGLSDGCDIGATSPETFISTLGATTDGRAFMIDTPSACCGQLSTVRFFANVTGTITTMVWRPTTGTNHELVGQEDVTADAIGLSGKGTSLDVEVGDKIGWKTTGVEYIPHNPTAPGSTKQLPLTTPGVGLQFVWPATADGNTYAFGARVTNEAPVVTAATVTIPVSQISSTVHPVVITDTDTVPVTDLTVTMTSTPATSELTLDGFDIKSGTTLTAGTYNLDVTATDRCGETASAIIQVIVQGQAPVFSPNPLETTFATPVSDDTMSTVPLYTFSVTDDNTITCSVDNPLFAVNYVAPNFELSLVPSSATSLNYDSAPSVTTTITCGDTTTNITSTYTVPISDKPPVMTGLGSTSTVGDLSVAAGDTITTFTVADQDDDITCTVDAPNTAVFTIAETSTPPGTQTFELKTSTAFNEDTTSSYTIGVTCTDGQTATGVVTGTHTLTVTDDMPTWSGLPATTTTQSDGSQTGSSIYAITVNDANDLASITCAIQTPNDVLFNITGTAPNFDVNTKPGSTLVAATAPYLLTITCKDDETTNVLTGTLTVPLVDTPPTFVGGFTPTESADLPDNTVAATHLGTFSVSESVTCSITNPSPSTPYEIAEILPPPSAPQSAFNIQVASTVTEADIKFEGGADVLLTIVCTDGTTPITDYFNVNIVDSAPVMTGLPAAPFNSVTDSESVGRPLVKFTVTDSDDSVTCSVVSTDPAAAVFEITTTTLPEYWISLKSAATLNADTTPSYTVPVSCVTDGADVATVTGSSVINIVSAPPVYVNMPHTTAAISDATIAVTPVHSFSVTDTPTSTITCTLSAPAPYNDDFTLVDSSPAFQVQLEATNDLNFDAASSIAVTITCTDGTTPITEILTVTVSDEDPVWTLLPASGPYQSLNDSTANATSLYTFSVTDSDDDIKCTVDPATPEATSFEIRNGTVPAYEVWFKGTPPGTLDATVAASHNVSIICTDGAAYSHTEPYQVDVLNGPAGFANLPNSVTVTLSEGDSSRQLLYMVTATDTTELTCYISNTVAVPGITLVEDEKTYTPPNTVYNLYAENAEGYDYESTPGSGTVDISCTDKVTAVTQPLTVTITNSGPVVKNPGGSITLEEDDATANDNVKTLDIIAYDKNDVTCTLVSNDGGPFTIDGTTIKKSAVALDYETKSFYTLTVKCEDTVGLSTTDTFTVNVNNKPLDVTNMPDSGEIREDQVDEVLLLALTLTEDAVKCEQVGTVETEFVMKLDPDTSTWSVNYVSETVAGKSLDYQNKWYYKIDVQCEDATGTKSAVESYYISVIPNDAPTFVNLPVNTVHEVKAKDVVAGGTVYAITTADTEGDDVTVKLVGCTNTTTCPFSLSGNDIISDVDLHSHSDDFYVLTVELEDKYNQNAGTRNLYIRISEINTNPNITNIPTYDVVGVMENNAAGDVVFQISVDDPDVDDVLVYTCDFTDGGEAHFTCDTTTGEIKAINPLNFEALIQKEYHVNVTVFDGYNTTAASELLTLKVIHENEQPEFNKLTWPLTHTGEGSNGASVGCPNFYDGIDDEDKANTFEYFTYTMTCATGEGAFVMNSKTGCVTMTREWDLDEVDKLTDTIPCTVTATDYGGLTTTATLNIEITEEDDKRPYLDKTSYKFCATIGTTSGTLGTISADDDDVAPEHKDLTFDFPGGGPFGSNGNNGALTYGDVSSYPLGHVFETSVRVRDAAGHTDTADVTVVICNPPTTTSSSSSNTNNSSSSSSSTDDMLLWLIPLILLGLLLLGLLAFLLYKYCGKCQRCRCARKPAKPVKLVRTVERRVVEPPVVEKRPPEKPAMMQLKMTRYYARETGNMFDGNKFGLYNAR